MFQKFIEFTKKKKKTKSYFNTGRLYKHTIDMQRERREIIVNVIFNELLIKHVSHSHQSINDVISFSPVNMKNEVSTYLLNVYRTKVIT